MKGAPGIQFVFSPFDRLIFTLSPSQLEKFFNLESSKPLFAIGRLDTSVKITPEVCSDTDSVRKLINSSKPALVDVTNIDLAAIKKECINAGLLSEKRSTLVIRYGDGNELQILKRPQFKQTVNRTINR